MSSRRIVDLSRPPRIRRPAASSAGSLARIALLAAISLITFPGTALGHPLGLSRGKYTVAGAAITAELTFAQRAIVLLLPELDRDHDESLSSDELQTGEDVLSRTVLRGLLVEGDGAPCAGKVVSAAETEADAIAFRLSYTCSAPPRKVRFDLAILDALPYGHRHVFRPVEGDGVSAMDDVLSRERRSIEVLTHPARGPGEAAVPQTEASTATASSANAAPVASNAPRFDWIRSVPERARSPEVLSFFAMGIQHILTGYDHLLFLFGLIVVGGSRRSLLLIVTAFTVAHSLTLALAVLGVWSPSPLIVEPAIALSIAYVGVENCFAPDAGKRWRITFPFGLVHGFGFAGALREIALPRGEVPWALAAFNLGVEAGQLAVLAVLLPLIEFARRSAWVQTTGAKLSSGLIAFIGLLWFVTRLAG